MRVLNNIIVIGASTGGPVTLGEVLEKMPVLDAAIIVVQHMPKFINTNIVKQLARKTGMKVKLAVHGETLEPGVVYFAPSEKHLKLIHNKRIELSRGEKVHSVCPAIDVTMKSLHMDFRHNLFGVVLTGMGEDGAEGIAHIKSLGGLTMVQERASCVIENMPMAALKTGQVDMVLPPAQIGKKLVGIIGPVTTTPEETAVPSPFLTPSYASGMAHSTRF